MSPLRAIELLRNARSNFGVGRSERRLTPTPDQATWAVTSRALFVEKGYAGATVADIAARAGVAVPTVYASVGPKTAILDELRQQMPIFEPIAARAWEEGLAIHGSGWAFVCQRLVTFGTLEQANAGRAADVMSMISLPQSWRTLCQEYGWSHDEIEGWIIATSLGLLAPVDAGVATTPAAADPGNTSGPPAL